jgi:hypothetical protein
VLTQRTLGFLDFWWLTMMDPSSDGYQNMLDKLCRRRRWYETLGCLRKTIQLTQAINLQWSISKIDPRLFWIIISKTHIISGKGIDVVGNKELSYAEKIKTYNMEESQRMVTFMSFSARILEHHFSCVLCSHIEKESTSNVF